MFFKKDGATTQRPFGVTLGQPLYETPPAFTPWQNFKIAVWAMTGPFLLLLAVVLIIYGLL